VTETKFYELAGVQVFDVGTWNGVTYSDEDLDEMVANFNELSAAGYDIPAKLGHGKQDLIDREDLPAAAYVKRLYRNGTKLVADFTRVPQKVKDIIDLGAYRTVSAEIYGKVQLLGKTFEKVVSAIAFLGGDIPAVGTLDDVIELYNRAGAKPHPLVFSTLPGATRHVATWTPQKEASMANKPGADTVDDEVVELDGELTKLADRAADATKGRAGAPAFRAFLHETLTKLRGLAKKNKSKNAAASTESYQDRIAELSDAVSEKFGGPDGYDAWLVDNGDDWLVMHWNGADWQCSYVDDDATGVITIGDPVEVERGPWQPINAAIKNKAGSTGKEDDMAITKALATALGLPENADEPAVLKAIGDLKAASETKFTALQQEVTDLKAREKTREAEKKVDDAIFAKKILPAQRDAMVKFALADMATFGAFVEGIKDPVVDTTTHGTDGDAPEARSEVAQFQAKVADKVKADTRAIDYGEKVAQAQREVSIEEPQLYAAVRGRK
jgi:hypothetical protein